MQTVPVVIFVRCLDNEKKPRGFVIIRKIPVFAFKMKSLVLRQGSYRYQVSDWQKTQTEYWLGDKFEIVLVVDKHSEFSSLDFDIWVTLQNLRWCEEFKYDDNEDARDTEKRMVAFIDDLYLRWLRNGCGKEKGDMRDE
ncbi:hypothetical protein A2533_02350 [Candidatus Falkowbacteria bacterium RIFOXYD2_FULL_35_9]|uniref:Uncharacterized protein n=1 Tax=Candidatus Falkowbacteria bacterium RIFOXYC2_FULL_36_12 TaxID=1798002 RepID=A0A1F5SWH1_9BACT|nr:MAG: hypothetical protein A2300_04750 [Candidatus Falkowbacteria bacterium RIFOXYB2_FULL_35_7]OGF30989.1 MAG: hypothetical protein A2478_00930 [Candidatus Falkowbacteria bacterium RIFOXYC2_FULL_36_12]OGF34417.1 MAG: hypothetical protein A2223_02730 [Candidatus Falkowbacteria bacterium RIFOXYA2_FULL_35_8]OGF45639.1 MAG: hypothetical protein A2533_02350 [Candidatus Falkowbacteria bacterium RIFOXYD2_FULL_35_9]